MNPRWVIPAVDQFNRVSESFTVVGKFLKNNRNIGKAENKYLVVWVSEETINKGYRSIKSGFETSKHALAMIDQKSDR